MVLHACHFIPVLGIKVADRNEPIHGRRIYPVAFTDEVLHGEHGWYAVVRQKDRNETNYSPVFPVSETTACISGQIGGRSIFLTAKV